MFNESKIDQSRYFADHQFTLLILSIAKLLAVIALLLHTITADMRHNNK